MANKQKWNILAIVSDETLVSPTYHCNAQVLTVGASIRPLRPLVILKVTRAGAFTSPLINLI